MTTTDAGAGAPTVNLTSYQELWDAFRQRDLRQGLYTAGGVVMHQTLLDLHGSEHQLRRRVENRLFRRGTFKSWEAELVPQIIDEAFAPVVAQGHADLVLLGTRTTMNLTAKVAGADRSSSSVEQTDALQQFAITFSEGATLVHTTRDPEVVRAEVTAALERFDTMFFTPSYDRRVAILADDSVPEQDHPKDVLMALVRNQEELGIDRQVMLREVAFYLQAGSHSTADAFTHSVDEILRWARENPAEAERLDDDLFVQRCVHEALRLHPASPEALREALVDVTMRDGRVIPEGSFVRMDIKAANADPEVFGPDAGRFNPDREPITGVQPWGHTFGGGMHACIGMELDGGTVPKDGDAEHVLGTVPLMVRELLRHGVRLDPEHPPTKEAHSKRDHFGSYRVLFRVAAVRVLSRVGSDQVDEVDEDVEDIADVVVVGFGAAGAAAALTAQREGASVIVLEKQAEHAHTPSTRMSGGLVMGVNDAEAAATYLDECAGGMVPREVGAVWARLAAELPGWLAELGLELTRIGGAEHPDVGGSESIDVYQPGAARRRLDPDAGAGTHLWAALLAAVQETSAEIHWAAPAERLIQDEHGRVAGVQLRAADGTARVVRARRGVVLTCGGFEFDEAMKLDFLRASPVYFYGNPGNSGDGVRMAQAVGADLWHMNQMIGRAIGSFETADGERLSFIIGIDPPGYVITDGAGERFADESAQARLLHGFYYELLKFDVETGRYPRIPCYWFFDETRRKAGPLTYSHLGVGAVGLYDWSPDNSVEVERGWIHRGDSIAEVAEAAGIADPKAAQASVERYNEACATGVDELGRPVQTLVPITEPPFYCVPLYPGGSNTTGGPRRDEHARVLHVHGGAIAGLYAAGELGQASGLVYPADGSNISEALCFGQVAARSALRESERPAHVPESL